MPKPASTRSAYKMLTCIYLCRTLLFFAPYADFLFKEQDSLVATPAVITGSPINIIPAIVQIMQNSFIARNIILTACDYYRFQEKEKIETKEMPQYLKEFIEELLNEL